MVTPCKAAKQNGNAPYIHACRRPTECREAGPCGAAQPAARRPLPAIWGLQPSRIPCYRPCGRPIVTRRGRFSRSRWSDGPEPLSTPAIPETDTPSSGHLFFTGVQPSRPFRALQCPSLAMHEVRPATARKGGRGGWFLPLRPWADGWHARDRGRGLRCRQARLPRRPHHRAHLQPRHRHRHALPRGFLRNGARPLRRLDRGALELRPRHGAVVCAARNLLALQPPPAHAQGAARPLPLCRHLHQHVVPRHPHRARHPGPAQRCGGGHL